MDAKTSDKRPVQLMRGAGMDFVLAAHEPPDRPGILKKVLVTREGFPPGRLQMINWAHLPVATQSWPHYHQDLHEAFVVVHGTVQFYVDQERFELGQGDMLLVPPYRVHVLRNVGSDDAELVVVGISEGAGGGKTIMLDGNIVE